MNRRAFLAALTTVGAGCAGNEENQTAAPTETSTATGTATPTSTATATRTATDTPTSTPYRPEQAASHIESARGDLKTAVREFRTESSQIEYTFSNPPRFDPAPTEAAIRNAREELQAAEGLATAEQQPTLSALRSYAEFLTGLVATMDAYVESLDHRYRAVIQEDNEQYETAIDRLEQAQSSLDTARTRLADARTLFQDLRANVREPNSVALTDAETSLQRLDELFTGLTTVYEGDIRLEQGLMEYSNGLDQFNDQHYSIAASSFSNAESDFLRAADIYAEGESDAPTELLDLVLRRQCQSDKYATAADEMGRACVFADTDPSKANEHIRAAGEALNKNC
ncbi:hypothetical protein [Haloplanus aerogenes]|nr:hypothetical protein [Haloplanus aerogenes]